MAEIADAVGLGVSSIYYYFANKHQLLERIVVDVNQTPLAAAELAAATFSDGPRRLHAFIRHDAAALCEFPFDINEIHRLAAEDRKTFERYWVDRAALVTQVQNFIRSGVAAGSFIDVDPSLAALTVLANDEAIQNWYRPSARLAANELEASAEPTVQHDNNRSPDQIGAFVADLALRGLLVDPSELDAIRRDTAGLDRPDDDVSRTPDS